ncbi:hypothetical protein [Ralstonia solanacearum]|uniref:hypothetical protein n=1 Tax=Ralstonia solanacearum TaxID=305 RepID=UPI0018D16EE0|nr:hypothetical protein [Ralstonia solanacearum]
MQPQTLSTPRASRRRGRISLQYLDEGQQHRLRAGFHAIAGRSIYQWDEVQPYQADVLVLGPEAAGASTAAPIKIWLCEQPPNGSADDAFQLPHAFSTHDLWGTLDRVALRLMDMPKRSAATSVECPMTRAAAAAGTADSEPTYRLFRWVTLEAPFQAQHFRRAMAAMTSRDVSLRWLTTYGGLELEEARLLLGTLSQMGVLQISTRHDTGSAAPPVHAQASRSHFFDLVGRWLHGSRQRLHTGH